MMLAKAASWALRNKGAVGAGIGGVSGFISSGGSGWGALAGAASGAVTGGKNVGYWNGAKSSKFVRGAAGKLSKGIRAKVPGFSFQTGMSMNPKMASSFGQSIMSGKMKSGHIRNIGSKHLGGVFTGLGASALAGLGGGVAGGMASSLFKSMGSTRSGNMGSTYGIGNSYGSENSSSYGSTFSGMGNGARGF